jgi:predicted DNA-binding protein (UPF0251 family)
VAQGDKLPPPAKDPRLEFRALAHNGWMARPRAPRSVAARPVATLFKPGGVPALAQIRMTLDEFEAIRLADLEELEHEQAGRKMGVSRPTFGRVLASARRKVAEALVFGRALRIEGGAVAPDAPQRARCPYCTHRCNPSLPGVCGRCGHDLVQLGQRRPRG